MLYVNGCTSKQRVMSEEVCEVIASGIDEEARKFYKMNRNKREPWTHTTRFTSWSQMRLGIDSGPIARAWIIECRCSGRPIALPFV